ncbi:hypothetical protein [Prosthecobacter sp.]|uniref:hypothetical protein n=1 Tax=Prosthecobacter sp. TaxID=1965333 RepID=UPI00378380FD
MYRAFNLTKHDWSAASLTSGETLRERHASTVRESLESFLKNGIIDGGALSTHWFPEIKADVFISHSHRNNDDALKCAGWLKDTFNLESFIDSSVWGYASDLLLSIDNEYSRRPDGSTYEYDKQHLAGSHVHMMLAVALNQMLDACECVIFLNSPESITSSESISETKSPWLFYELSLMRTIRRTKPGRLQVHDLVEKFLGGPETTKAASLEVKYPVPLSELTKLDEQHLGAWKRRYELFSNPKHPLDILYDLAPERTQ